MLDCSPSIGPTANWALDPCPDRGRPAVLLADGPLSRSAIKRKVKGRGAKYEIHRRRQRPTEVPSPSPI